MQQRFAVFLLVLIVIFGLSSCNSELTTSGDSGALAIINDSLPEAYFGEAYTANIRAVRGLTPYTFELSKGELPPGLELSGGSIVGTPSGTGTFNFTITVSDAKLSKTFTDFSLVVTEPPPAELSLNVPQTEIQRTITLRADLKNVRDLQAFRALISWDSERFEFVEGSLRASRDNLALFSQLAPGALNVDLAVLGGSLSADRRMFEFELRPIEPSLLAITSKVEFLSSQNKHSYAVVTEGQSPVPEVPAPNPDETDPLINPDPTNPDAENNGGSGENP
ncbi:MAG: putative Ig domain-containing protein [Trueperaceae bacterium]|nr:putative Ig domain-containing protein [Trueperaceae bacterium]